MQTLQIIVTVLASMAYAVCTYMAITSFFMLRRTRNNIMRLSRDMERITALALSTHIKQNFEHLAKMKALFERLVEEEKFEEADKLKKQIAFEEKQTNEALQEFKDMFGDDSVSIIKVD